MTTYIRELVYTECNGYNCKCSNYQGNNFSMCEVCKHTLNSHMEIIQWEILKEDVQDFSNLKFEKLEAEANRLIGSFLID